MSHFTPLSTATPLLQLKLVRLPFLLNGPTKTRLLGQPCRLCPGTRHRWSSEPTTAMAAIRFIALEASGQRLEPYYA